MKYAIKLPYQLESSWEEALHEELQKPYMDDLALFLQHEEEMGMEIFPPRDLVFNAFFKTPFEKTRVVIVGQDPYHGPGQAHGLSFSVQKGVNPPPSLQNIYKELRDDVGFTIPKHGCLESWAEQGVLMLNATLTVRARQPKSHWARGWEKFTDSVIKVLSHREDPIIFVLWGKSAQEKCKSVLNSEEAKRHALLMAAHPSPYSAHHGFLGCKHFSKINSLLSSRGAKPIDWNLQ
ncbi:MAG: uracil-DNA glycosylase [Parachlamydiales bacterium]|nr:uracil-DNA glycosylase [Parachlamydiales bacterium]